MLDQAIIEELDRGYICPPDAGPAWRAACEYGFDMSLVEDALNRSPEARLDQHQRMLDMVLKLNPALSHEGGRERDLLAAKLLRAIKEKQERA